jgi:predicted protein tyrosine phosphatase
MKIKILNKYSIKEYEPEEENVLIRITSQLPFSKIKENKYKKIYQYGFEDLPYECNYSISKEEAINLIKNLEENKDKKEIIIHCDYGQSRSPAVGIAYSYILFGEDKYNLKEEYPDYNRYVVEMIKKEYNEILKLSEIDKNKLYKEIKGEI